MEVQWLGKAGHHLGAFFRIGQRKDDMVSGARKDGDNI